MKKTFIAAGFLSATFTLAALADNTGASPYAGQESRDIKALSATEVQDYLAGKGMGLSKVAELNSRPGPAHVLQHAGEMQLTASQLEQVTAINRQMQADAVALGKALVRSEAALQAAVLEPTPSQEKIARLIDESAVLQGRLRAVHVLAHMKTAALLTPEQIARYDRLRGYAQATANPADVQTHHHRH